MRNQNRVLARQGARVLTSEEVQRTTSGAHLTDVVTLNPIIFRIDGDGIHS